MAEKGIVVTLDLSQSDYATLAELAEENGRSIEDEVRAAVDQRLPPR